ncbi:hypothetical protein ACIPWE_40190 [Streptomyces sp. NPDC090073]|uniref:hypothetical protein n=1 Tax=Streptomyces sp. NPDC090073 TaxID=3365936 RepID=UPI0038236787
MTDAPRDTTAAGLIAKLQEIISIRPEAAGWDVMMEDMDTGRNTPWRGTVFQYPEDGTLQLEGPS